METELPILHCTGNACDWYLSGDLPVCYPGSSTCNAAKLLEAEVSSFHDQTLATVTAQINALLQAIPPDPSGRKLSFMHTRLGTLLGWVDHGEASVATDIAVNATSDDAAIIQALKLVL